MKRSPASRCALTAARKAACGGGSRQYRRRMKCACGNSYRYQPGNDVIPDRCPDCAAKLAAHFTVFDRDRGIGRLPANLAHYANG